MSVLFAITFCLYVCLFLSLPLMFIFFALFISLFGLFSYWILNHISRSSNKHLIVQLIKSLIQPPKQMSGASRKLDREQTPEQSPRGVVKQSPNEWQKASKLRAIPWLMGGRVTRVTRVNMSPPLWTNFHLRHLWRPSSFLISKHNENKLNFHAL